MGLNTVSEDSDEGEEIDCDDYENNDEYEENEDGNVVR